MHAVVPGHMLWHAPQLGLLWRMSTQSPAQQRRPCLHLWWQRPQLLQSSFTFTHCFLQQLNSGAHGATGHWWASLCAWLLIGNKKNLLDFSRVSSKFPDFWPRSSATSPATPGSVNSAVWGLSWSAATTCCLLAAARMTRAIPSTTAMQIFSSPNSIPKLFTLQFSTDQTED